MKVLVIDDQTGILKYTLERVKDAGNELIIPDMSSERWQGVLDKANACDVILLDLLMDANELFAGAVIQDHVGVELLRRLRRENCHRPVVILTHLSLGANERTKLKALGVEHVLSKTERKTLLGLATTLEQARQSGHDH